MKTSRILSLNYDPRALSQELRLRQRTAAMIEALRIESGLTYEEIQSKVGISEQELKSWETGFKSPMLSSVGEYMAHCGIEPAVRFQISFSALLMESQQRISQLQAFGHQHSRPINFSALGAVGGIPIAA